MFESFFQCGVLVLLAAIVLGIIGVIGHLQELMYHIGAHASSQNHTHHHVHTYESDVDEADFWKNGNNGYGNPN